MKEPGLQHVVITSVTKDDLTDIGAAHFTETIKTVKMLNNYTTIYVRGYFSFLEKAKAAGQDIVNYNMATVPRLY